MATQGQGQFASPWSPRTLLTGLTPTSLSGKTAGMAFMRLSSARTAASTGELPTGSQDMGGEVRTQGWAVESLLQLVLSGHRAEFSLLALSPALQANSLCLKLPVCASALSSAYELCGVRMGP